MPTIIESFMLEMGWETNRFKRDAAEIRAEIKRTADEVRKSSKRMTDDEKEEAREYKESLKEQLKAAEDAARAQEKAGKDQESSNKRQVESLSKIRNEVAALILTVAGASSIKNLFEHMIGGEASAGRLSANLNMSTSRLMAWQAAVKTVGGSPGDADAALARVQQIYNNRQFLGDTSMDAYLTKLGITDPSQLANPSEGLLKMMEAAQRMPKGEYSWTMGQLSMPQSVTNLGEQGRGSVETLLAQQERLAQVTQRDVAAAEQLQSDLAKLSTTIQGDVRPAVTALAEKLTTLAEGGKGAEGVLDDMTGPLIVIAALATAAGAPFIALAAAIGAVATQWDKIESGWQGFEDWYNKAQASTDTHSPFNDGLNHLRGLFGIHRAGTKTDAEKAYDAIWGTGGGAALPAPTSASAPASGDRASRAKAFFMANGLTAVQATGVVAAMRSENASLDPNASGPLTRWGHRAYGLGQWLSPSRIRNFERVMGRPLAGSTFDQQLKFFLWELQHTHHGAGIMAAGATSAAQAGSAIINGFYMPGSGTMNDYKNMMGYLRGGGGGMNVGTVVVQLPNVKDAHEFARQLPAATRRKALAVQVQSGVSG